jgi:hypothetical protein
MSGGAFESTNKALTEHVKANPSLVLQATIDGHDTSMNEYLTSQNIDPSRVQIKQVQTIAGMGMNGQPVSQVTFTYMNNDNKPVTGTVTVNNQENWNNVTKEGLARSVATGSVNIVDSYNTQEGRQVGLGYGSAVYGTQLRSMSPHTVKPGIPIKLVDDNGKETYFMKMDASSTGKFQQIDSQRNPIMYRDASGNIKAVILDNTEAVLTFMGQRDLLDIQLKTLK